MPYWYVFLSCIITTRLVYSAGVVTNKKTSLIAETAYLNNIMNIRQCYAQFMLMNTNRHMKSLATLGWFLVLLIFIQTFYMWIHAICLICLQLDKYIQLPPMNASCSSLRCIQRTLCTYAFGLDKMVQSWREQIVTSPAGELEINPHNNSC